MARYFLDEVFCLDFEQILDGDLLAVGLSPLDEGVCATSAFKTKLLIKLHLLKVLRHCPKVAHFQELLLVELEEREDDGEDEDPAPSALIQVQLLCIARIIFSLLGLSVHGYDEIVEYWQDVPMVADPASEHRHDPLGRDHLRLHLQALHEVGMQRRQVLLQELLQREVLQMVLVHLLHIEALELLFEDERNHALERHLLGFVRICSAASHYLVEYDRYVIDALAVARLREHLGTHRVKDS